MSEWISVEDRLPEDSYTVIANVEYFDEGELIDSEVHYLEYFRENELEAFSPENGIYNEDDGKYYCPAGWYYKTKNIGFDSETEHEPFFDGDLGEVITHWMPKPKPIRKPEDV